MPKKKSLTPSGKSLTISYPSIQDKKKKIEEQKPFFENNLAEKEFLYAYIENQEITFQKAVFSKGSFLHLTGIDYKGRETDKRIHGIIKPKCSQEFYSRLCNDSTLIRDVSFIGEPSAKQQKQTFMNTQSKLASLSSLTTISAKADFIGEFDKKKYPTKKYDFVISKGAESLLFIKDSNGLNQIYPSSSQQGNFQNIVKNPKTILAIFVKEKSKDDFQLQYLNKAVSLHRELFTDELRDMLSYSSFENTGVLFNLAKLNDLKNAFDKSVQKGIRKELSELSFLRANAFHSEDEMNLYIAGKETLMDKLDNIQKCEHALEELKNQFAEITGNNNSEPENKDLLELLKEEYLAIKDKWSNFNKELINPHSMEFVFIVPNSQIQADGTLAIQKTVTLQVTLPPKKPFRALFQKLEQFGRKLKEKVSEILNFSKKHTDDVADSDSMNTHTPLKSVSSDLLKEKKDSQQTVFQQEETYSLAQKSKSYRIIFQENAGQNIQNCAGYDMIIADKNIAEDIISNSVGRQAEREIHVEKEVKQMEENIYQEQYQEQDFSEPEKKYDYEYDR